jgi:hypothetical protein
MPILIKNIVGEVVNETQVDVKFLGILSELNLEDYIKVDGLIAMLQNFSHAVSVTELFIEGLDAFRVPDNGNHPTLPRNGYNAKTPYVELTISYT